MKRISIVALIVTMGVSMMLATMIALSGLLSPAWGFSGIGETKVEISRMASGDIQLTFYCPYTDCNIFPIDNSFSRKDQTIRIDIEFDWKQPEPNTRCMTMVFSYTQTINLGRLPTGGYEIEFYITTYGRTELNSRYTFKVNSGHQGKIEVFPAPNQPEKRAELKTTIVPDSKE